MEKCSYWYQSAKKVQVSLVKRSKSTIDWKLDARESDCFQQKLHNLTNVTGAILSSVYKQELCLPWVSYPSQRNDSFVILKFMTQIMPFHVFITILYGPQKVTRNVGWCTLESSLDIISKKSILLYINGVLPSAFRTMISQFIWCHTMQR